LPESDTADTALLVDSVREAGKIARRFFGGTYKSWESRAAHLNRMLARVQATPGIVAAAGTLTAMPPYVGFNDDFEIVGRPKADAGQKTRIGVTGHADRSGSDAYNMALSLRRANAVKDQLVREGIPASAITVVGRGESQPLVQTADGVREPQNRRVEIVLQ